MSRPDIPTQRQDAVSPQAVSPTVPSQRATEPSQPTPAAAWRSIQETTAWMLREARNHRRHPRFEYVVTALLKSLTAVGVKITLPDSEADASKQHQPLKSLTERELQVLRGISKGQSNAEIGRELFVSEDTVKTHARRLYRKLRARDRAHAVAVAFQTGLLS